MESVRRRVAVVALSCAGILACAARAPHRAETAPRTETALSRAVAMNILETTDTFAGTAVGYDGEASEQACAFAVLVREPDAREIFHALLERGGVAGQLYALCGLYSTDPAAFRARVEPYRRRADEVKTLEGCIGRRQPVGQIVEHTGPRAVRLTSPRETLREWVKRDPGRGRGYFLDIYGGGYPASFRALRPCRGVP